MTKKKTVIKCMLFLGILAVLLHITSWFSVQMDRSYDPLLNHSARSIFAEPDETIDTLFIGDSNVYSGVSPMVIWKNYGFTGYAWGEPSQRITETYEYLKEIYKHQKPKVVFIEPGNVFRDKSDVSNLDSLVKAMISRIFPVVTYHKNLDLHKLRNMKTSPRSITKGFYIREQKKKPRTIKMRSEKTHERVPVSKVAQKYLKKSIELCQKNGSEVVLLSIPSYNAWNTKKHNSLKDMADKNKIPFVDLNLILEKNMNWKNDTPDGTHLNIIGAKKVSEWMGAYLDKHYDLQDHRDDPAYKQWEEDSQIYEKKMKAEVN